MPVTLFNGLVSLSVLPIMLLKAKPERKEAQMIKRISVVFFMGERGFELTLNEVGVCFGFKKAKVKTSTKKS